MIKNYTTSIAEDKTVGEIMGLLAAKGARSIRIDYDELNRPNAVSFIVAIQDWPVPFKLPCNFEGVFKAMKRERVRHVYQWEQKPENKVQVFLPYAVVNQSGVTAFDQFMLQVTNQKALPEAK